MSEAWKVLETRRVLKAVPELPIAIQQIYLDLIDDLKKEGPWPHGWDVARLQGGFGIRIKLKREYRVIIEAEGLIINIVKIGHRKEIYE